MLAMDPWCLPLPQRLLGKAPAPHWTPQVAGWLAGWVDEWMAGWMDGLMDG